MKRLGLFALLMSTALAFAVEPGWAGVAVFGVMVCATAVARITGEYWAQGTVEGKW